MRKLPFNASCYYQMQNCDEMCNRAERFWCWLTAWARKCPEEKTKPREPKCFGHQYGDGCFALPEFAVCNFGKECAKATKENEKS